MFVEISEELARLKGIQNGERVNVKSARGQVECSAIVTKRFKPFMIGGLTVTRWGFPGIMDGDGRPAARRRAPTC
jgi:formate dehydrogenase major subunit